jgi:hypothetical protein
VYFGLHFEDKFEQQLSKIFFSVLFVPYIGTDRRQETCPQLTRSGSQRQGISSSANRIFPRVEISDLLFLQRNRQFQYLYVYIALFGNLVKNTRSTASFLASFRNYTYYHIQAWKVYLHSRVLRRINIVLKDLKQAQIEPFPVK